MKLCLINLIVDTNYGGTLQRFAMCRYLQQMGHRVEYVPVFSVTNIPKGFIGGLIYGKRYLKKWIGRYSSAVDIEKRISREYKLQMFQIESFMHRNIPCYKHSFCEFESMEELNEQGFDAFIVGSDQVWRSSPKKNIEHYFFNFLHDGKAKRIAYAASFGDDGKLYTPSQIDNCRNLIAKFDGISLRETIGLEIIQRNEWVLKNTPTVVLDPTLLLNKAVYTNLIKAVSTESRSGIFCYILDMNSAKRDFVNRVAEKLHKPMYMIDTLFPNMEKSDKDCYSLNPSIEQWLRNISDADFVITDSFHGTLFSILFNKSFFTIGNLRRGRERYTPILTDLGLDGRLLNEDALQIDLNDDLIISNWDSINQALETKRNESIDFLTRYL